MEDESKLTLGHRIVAAVIYGVISYIGLWLLQLFIGFKIGARQAPIEDSILIWTSDLPFYGGIGLAIMGFIAGPYKMANLLGWFNGK